MQFECVAFDSLRNAPMQLLAMSAASIPVIIGLGVIAAATLTVAAIWLVHTYNVSAGRKELAAYKDQVVALSDKLDALKERHKILPYFDKDFASPMSGETLAAYNEVASRLEHHRAEWLKLMDVWEQAQGLLQSEGMFGYKRARTARRNLRAAAAPAGFQALLRDCEAPLDRIEQAHEKVEQETKSFRQEDHQLGTLLESIAAASLSVAPYQPDRSAARTFAERVQGLLSADPLAALRCLSEARLKIAAVNQLAVRIQGHLKTAHNLAARIADVERLIAQRRSQGFLLREEGTDPDPLMAAGGQHRAVAHGALNQADDTSAGAALAKALAQIQQAQEGMERHVAAKARCEAEISKRQNEVRRLADAHALSRGQQAELTRDFVADAWLGVAENNQRAQASLALAQRLTEQAAQSAAANVQHYLRACKALDEAADIHKQTEPELEAVGQRLRELVEMRAGCQAQIGQLRGITDRVQHLLQSSSADRALANERFRTARAALDRLADDVRLPRPDWSRLKARAAEIQADLERVEKLAREDIQLAQQAAAEIAESERVVRDAKAFHELGFTADIQSADSLLAQARGSAAAQGYEEAIRLANESERSARGAHQEAMARAQRRRQEIEAQHRAEQAKAAAALMTPAPLLQAEADDPAILGQREI